DGSLQAEGSQPGFEAKESCCDGLGLEVHLAHLRCGSGLPGDAAAALPVHVDGLNGLQTEVHRAIDRGTSLLKDAADAERLVLMLHKRDGTEPVRDDYGIANSITQSGRHVGADHGIE